jgi:hypothetical protein
MLRHPHAADCGGHQSAKSGGRASSPHGFVLRSQPRSHLSEILRTACAEVAIADLLSPNARAFFDSFMSSPTATVATITVTACAIFSALPNFWAIPPRFLTGARAAAGIALINTVGNVAGFAAPYVIGAVKDATGSCLAKGYHGRRDAPLGHPLVRNRARGGTEDDRHGAARTDSLII